MQDLIWIIPALPLAGFLILLVAGRRLGEPGAGVLATAVVGGAFVASVATFVELVGRSAEERRLTVTLFEWIHVGSFQVDMGFLADPLSITMCLFVTGIGTLIHLYAIGYMHGDENFSKFFLYLNLFVFSMLMLVLGDNLLLTFLGWEGVGACSYLLISFWHTDPANASAGKKAFVTNRVGDLGYMLGLFLVWTTVGTISYAPLADALHADPSLITGVTATAIVLCFFVGATGKSAQLPLFVWLPDAMAGPTPVSALIHAATMVTSGVYLLVRINPILAEAGWANDVVAWVGALTALVAATIAVAQNDIKKVLAYSTVSQLGYMFLAVGTGSYVAAVFHMVTHAFFKALLFLGSGSVIHAMAHEQDMRRYGNLRKYLPITSITFIIGWLAIAGVPPFAGFWSKDEILAGAWSANPALWVVGLLTALITAFYMTRQVILTFFSGEERWRQPVEVEGNEGADHDTHDDHHHGLTPEHQPHESPWTMTVPLMVLAVLAVFGGFLNLPFSKSVEFLGHWLEPVIAHGHARPSASTLVILAVVAVAVAVVGLAAAHRVYEKRKGNPDAIEARVFADGWYIDSGYARFMGGPGRRAFDLVTTFDRTVIDGAVNGVAALVRRAGTSLRPVQSGQVRTYALGIAIGVVLLLGFVITQVNV